MQTHDSRLVPSLAIHGANAELTMSSRDIADLIDARHDSVKRTMERLQERDIISFSPVVETSHDGAGARPVTVYRVNKRNSYVVVAQMCPEFTARLVDRWQYLEERASGLPDFNDPIAAARAWIAAKEREQAVVKALEAAAPKVEGYDFFIGAKQENMNLQRSMKILGTSPNKAIKALRSKKVLYGTPATPTQYYRDKGYFVMLPVEDKNEKGKMRPQTFVTPKGLDWLRSRLPEFMGGGSQ